MFNAIEAAASGMQASRARVEVAASNLANAETTHTAEGGPYKRRDVVIVSKSSPSSFATVLDRMTLERPQVQAVVEDNTAPRKVYNPAHPDADKDGYVGLPNINIVSEMVNMTTAKNLYDANASVMKAVSAMTDAALSIAG